MGFLDELKKELNKQEKVHASAVAADAARKAYKKAELERAHQYLTESGCDTYIRQIDTVLKSKDKAPRIKTREETYIDRYTIGGITSSIFWRDPNGIFGLLIWVTMSTDGTLTI